MATLCAAMISEARALQDEIVADRRALHQIPEVGMALPETVAYVSQRLDSLGITWRPCGIVAHELTRSYESLGYPGIDRSTGIVATVGSGAGPCILLRADMDALPIIEENDLPFKSTRACSHMCGHDAHTAMLLAAAAVLKRHEAELPGTVKLMFQPGEELGAGSKTMIDDGALEAPHVDAAFGLHVMSNEPAGQVSFAPGVSSTSLDTFVIKIQGRGGHTSAPQQCIDPLMVANQVYQALNLMMTREVEPAAAITLSCGALQAGTVPNTLPDTADLKFGLRSLNVAAREHVLSRIPELVEGYVKAWRASSEVAMFNCPSVVTDPLLASELQPAFAAVVGSARVLKAEPMAATEDFSYVSAAVPSVFAILGAGSPGAAPHHNPHMHLDEQVFWMGAALHVAVVATWFERHALSRQSIGRHKGASSERA